MKIALAQINYHIGNFEENVAKIIRVIEAQKAKGTDMVVFSEMAVCGYPPQDFLEQRDFVTRCEQSIEEIARVCQGIAAIVGGPKINDNPKGKMLFNTAFLLFDGEIKSTHYKTLLPTYDIFDEYRYFEPNTLFFTAKYKNIKFAITICEDLWDNQPVENSFAKNKLYVKAPMKELAKQNPAFIINIAASPFSYTQDRVRKDVLVENAKKYALPVVYVNQIGAHTELIFDGGSLALNLHGQTILQLNHFDEDIQIIDTNDFEKQVDVEAEAESAAYPKIQKIHDALVLGIKDYFGKMGFAKATLGLSGGIDSAVTLALAAEALGSENLRVLLMPSKYSSDHSITDAVGLAENLGVQYDIASIEEAVKAFDNTFAPIFKDLPPGLAEENIQARLRGVLLMGLSNKFGHILLNTSNKSEAATGYGTLYGDMNGSLSVLGDVYKTDVFKLAWYINRNKEIIPVNTITKPPSAELRPDQKDSDSLPDYDLLDAILYNYIELKLSASEIIAKGFDAATVSKTIKLVNRNEFKRFQAPPVLRVSNKAFGMGRRMPLVAAY